MSPINAELEREQKRRELEPYLKFIRNMESDRNLDTRLSHIVYDLFEDDVEWLVDALSAAEVTAGFSVPAIHLTADGPARDGIQTLAAAGHEIVAHGYRHTSYMDTSYETASEELAEIEAVFDRTLGVDPAGLHVPFMRCSAGTVEAAAEHGIEWIVGAPGEGGEGPPMEFLRPESPYDLQLFERGHSPTEVAERLSERAEGGSLLLCHPNIQAIHGATEEFGDWIAETSPVPPSAIANGEADRPGLLLDCFPPFQVR